MSDAGTILDALISAALGAVEPAQAVSRALSVASDGVLRVGERTLRLDAYRRAIVVGAGKASAPMAAAVETVLSPHVQVVGSVTVRYGHTAPTQHVTIREAAHPMPDQRGVDATRAIVDLLAGADERDLVICVISGGGSALLTLPVEGISLTELQTTTDVLLRSGASINDINVVRKHLDVVKGGGLARLAAPADLVTLVLSDVVGNPLDAIASGPTVPDTSSFADAAAVFDRFGLWDLVAGGVCDRVREGLAGRLKDTPTRDDPVFARTSTVVIGSNLLACQAAARRASEEFGLHALILSTYVEGEAREVARALAGILREVDASGLPLPRPCAIIAGGETTVTVRGQGRGGRNQELALAAAFPLAGLPDVWLASIGTDGNDGPTDAAGAVCDGTTLSRARALQLDARAALAQNDSYPFFAALGDLITTGPTNTNVNDLIVLLAL